MDHANGTIGTGEAYAPLGVPAPACECHDAVTSIRQDLDNLLTIVKAIHEEVGPTLDALKNNPMLKMFFK